MTNVSLYSFIIYFFLYTMILIAGILFGIFIYHCFKDNNKSILPIYSSSNNEENMKVIKTMKKDLIINKDKYSFIEINDIINIYIKNKCEIYENKRKQLLMILR